MEKQPLKQHSGNLITSFCTVKWDLQGDVLDHCRKATHLAKGCAAPLEEHRRQYFSPPPSSDHPRRGGKPASCVALGRNFGVSFRKAAPARTQLRPLPNGSGVEPRTGGGTEKKATPKTYLGQRKTRLICPMAKKSERPF